MWALNALGIDEYADERTIKKAYAKLLKQTRPDENPQDFQELNDAYKAALAWRKNNPLKEQSNLQINTENTEPQAIAPQEENSAPSEDINSLLHKILDDTQPAISQKNPDQQALINQNDLSKQVAPDFNINNYYWACMKIVNTGTQNYYKAGLRSKHLSHLKN